MYQYFVRSTAVVLGLLALRDCTGIAQELYRNCTGIGRGLGADYSGFGRGFRGYCTRTKVIIVCLDP